MRTYWNRDVDISGDVWELDERFRLDFGFTSDWPECERPAAAAFKAFIADCMRRMPTRSIDSYFYRIGFALRCPDVRAAIPQCDDAFMLAVLKRFATSRKSVKSRAALLRRWYLFAESEGFEGFDADAALAMAAVTFRTQRFGTAVLRQDPSAGPLTPAEFERLMAALRSARCDEAYDIQDVAAAMMFAVFGVNPENLRKLDERNVTQRRNAAGERILEMPRIKKRVGNAFGRYKLRPLSNELCSVLDELKARNARLFPPDSFPDTDEEPRPLFIRQPSGQVARPTRVTVAWFQRCVGRLPEMMGLTDDKDEPLRLYPRRLRYTFATRQVALGRTPEELQELLDHGSLESLMIYYNPRLDLITRLDTTVGPQLAPFAAMAAGLEPIPEAEPLPGDLASPDGAPFACLTCRMFQPVEREPIAEVGEVAAAQIAKLGSINGATGDEVEPARDIAAWQAIALNVPRAIAAINGRTAG